VKTGVRFAHACFVPFTNGCFLV